MVRIPIYPEIYKIHEVSHFKLDQTHNAGEHLVGVNWVDNLWTYNVLRMKLSDIRNIAEYGRYENIRKSTLGYTKTFPKVQVGPNFNS